MAVDYEDCPLGELAAGRAPAAAGRNQAKASCRCAIRTNADGDTASCRPDSAANEPAGAPRCLQSRFGRHVRSRALWPPACRSRRARGTGRGQRCLAAGGATLASSGTCGERRTPLADAGLRGAWRAWIGALRSRDRPPRPLLHGRHAGGAGWRCARGVVHRRRCLGGDRVLASRRGTPGAVQPAGIQPPGQRRAPAASARFHPRRRHSRPHAASKADASIICAPRCATFPQAACAAPSLPAATRAPGCRDPSGPTSKHTACTAREATHCPQAEYGPIVATRLYTNGRLGDGGRR